MVDSTLQLPAWRAQIQGILESDAFRTSEVQRNLLTYLAEKSFAGTADALKEYTVGLEVFGKPASYDPRQESVVRMHSARLRQRLAEYYRTEGVDAPVIVDLPKGGFTLTFTLRQPAAVDRLSPQASSHRRERALAAALLVAIVCASYLAIRLRRAERSTAETPAAWTPELQQLWSPLLSPSRPLMVCLDTPMFVRVPGFGFVRESSSNDSHDLSKSKNISLLQEALQVASVDPSYKFTGVGTANAAFLLGQFLAQHKQNIVLTTSDLLSMPEIAMSDVVFLGPPTGNRHNRAIPVDQEFVLEPEGIRNVRPQPGEPAFMADRPTHDVEEVEETYALISHVPGLYGNGNVLYLSSNGMSGVMAAVQAFTDPAFARILVSKMKTAVGSVPHYYQVVLKVRSMDDMPVDISYLFHRELSVSKQASAAQR